MGDTTKIAWTRSTFNPWIGCTRIGPGCDACYAEQQDSRKRWGGTTHWGAGVPRMRTSVQNWNRVLRWDRLAAEEKRTGHITPKAEWNHPGFWPVFCASLADVFDNEVPDEWRGDLWRLIRATPYLSWLLVTKRIGNAVKMWPGGDYQNVRLLITVCNQEEADRDIPKLLALPCKNGISYEPALGPVDFHRDSRGGIYHTHHGIEWLIIGGESGPKARTFDIEWARSAVKQCKAAGVACFVKQLGARSYASNPALKVNKPFRYMPKYADDETGQAWVQLRDRAGADPSEWPEDLRIREFPQ